MISQGDLSVGFQRTAHARWSQESREASAENICAFVALTTEKHTVENTRIFRGVLKEIPKLDPLGEAEYSAIKAFFGGKSNSSREASGHRRLPQHGQEAQEEGCRHSTGVHFPMGRSVEGISSSSFRSQQ